MSDSNPKNPVLSDAYSEEKRRLFSEIQLHLETSRFDLSVSSIQDKIERYNAIRDQEDALIPDRGCDPLKILPVEIWEDIIHECASIYAESPTEWNIGEVIKLTNVSKLWQNTILSTPSFWRNIRVDISSEDLEATVALCLHLSKDAPLKISLQIPTPCWETLGPMINSQGSRIRSIFLLLGRLAAASELSEEVNSTLERLDNLTSIQEFSSNLGFGNFDSFFRKLSKDADLTSNMRPPSLSRLHVGYMDSNALEWPVFSRIWYINFWYPPSFAHVALSSVAGFQYLRQIIFKTVHESMGLVFEAKITMPPNSLQGWRPPPLWR